MTASSRQWVVLSAVVLIAFGAGYFAGRYSYATSVQRAAVIQQIILDTRKGFDQPQPRLQWGRFSVPIGSSRHKYLEYLLPKAVALLLSSTKEEQLAGQTLLQEYFTDVGLYEQNSREAQKHIQAILKNAEFALSQGHPSVADLLFRNAYLVYNGYYAVDVAKYQADVAGMGQAQNTLRGLSQAPTTTTPKLVAISRAQIALKDEQGAQHTLRRVINDGESVSVLCEAAQEAHQAQLVEIARDLLYKAVEKADDNPDDWENIASSWMRIGDYNQSNEARRRALMLRSY